MKCSNIRIIRVPEEDKKKDHEKILEEIVVESFPNQETLTTTTKRKIKRNEDNLRDLWNNDKCPNIQIIGVPEEEDKNKRA